MRLPCGAMSMQDSLANDREFQKRYMFPVEYKISKKKKSTLEADEGITRTKEGLAALKSLFQAVCTAPVSRLILPMATAVLLLQPGKRHRN